MPEGEDGNTLNDRTVLSAAGEDGSTTPFEPAKGSPSFVEVSLNERLADNPLNARNSVGELDGLEASIRARGLLQPLIVARAEVFHSAHPEVSVGPEAEWVLLAGHRRRVAARRAGLGTAIAIVRDDLVKSEDCASVSLVENVHRAGLSPLEEARVLSVLRDLGLPQREISRQTGISQGQISRRLQLLELPIELQDCIDDGRLAIADALTMLHELSDPREQLRALRLSQDGGRSLKHVLRQLRRDRAAQNVVTEQTPGQGNKASGEGLEQAGNDDPTVRLEVRGPEVSATTAVIAAKLADTKDAIGFRESQEGLESHAAACLARIKACRRAVQSRLSVEQIVDVLVDATLDLSVLRSAHASDQANSMAAEWTATTLPKDFDASNPYNVLQGTRDAAQRLAVAIVFAHREIDLASVARVLQPWHEGARRHVRRLADWGMHVPTEYERAKLAESSVTERID